jgi:hypothetical protein
MELKSNIRANQWSPNMTIEEIIKAAGGAKAIADASAGTIKRDAVYKWAAIGIPDRHWPILILLAGVTPQQLFDANLLARVAA